MLNPLLKKKTPVELVINNQQDLAMLLYQFGKQANISTNQYSWTNLSTISNEQNQPNNKLNYSIISWNEWQEIADNPAWQEVIKQGQVICGFIADAGINNILNTLQKDSLAKEKFIKYLTNKNQDLPLSIYFPSFVDGRAYSLATILREEFNYQGALWAFGEVLVDQVLPMMRVGFDGAILRAGQNAEIALKQLSCFSVQMQDDWRKCNSNIPQQTNYKTPLWQIPQIDWSDELAIKSVELQQRLTEIILSEQRVAFSNSYSAEDIVITHNLLAVMKKLNTNNNLTTESNKNDLNINEIKEVNEVLIFSLDTKLLPTETLQFHQQITKFFDYDFRLISADREDVNELIANDGENGFYQSETKKKNCCQTRKVNPLNKLLTDFDIWITGQRQEQALTRANLALLEPVNDNLKKFNPIFDWSEDEIWAYIHHYQLPIHPLYFRGYASIGCSPCTRAIKANESVRAGRWWWLDESKKECGLHLNAAS